MHSSFLLSLSSTHSLLPSFLALFSARLAGLLVRHASRPTCTFIRCLYMCVCVRVHNSTHTAIHVHIHICVHHSIPPIYRVSPPVLLEFRAGVLRLPMKWGDNEPLTPFATRCAPVRGFFPRISLHYAYRMSDVSVLFPFLSARSRRACDFHRQRRRAFRSMRIFFYSFYFFDRYAAFTFFLELLLSNIFYGFRVVTCDDAVRSIAARREN